MALVEIPLTGGAYQARALIAGAQEAINLYPERNPKDSQAPTPVTTYGTPGLTALIDAPPATTAWRQLYRTSTGRLFGVLGDTIYDIDANWNLTAIGAIPFATSPVSMRDNGLVLLIADGSDTLYTVALDTLNYATIGLAQGYLPSTRIAYLDTFFLFNVVDTNAFYASLSNVDQAMLIAGTAFDPLDIAAKTVRADPLVFIDVVNGELWVVGQFTAEVWALVGGAGFPFARIPGAVVNHGCSATFGEAQADINIFWLGKDDQGFGTIFQTVGYDVGIVSTYAMARAFQHYTTVEDCIMYTRQEDGHYFLVVIFPSANVTWEMDIGTKQWHKWASTDDNGNLNRHRSNCYVEYAGKSVVGDYQNGKLYDLDHMSFTDDGTPIIRRRSFPVVVLGGHEQQFHSLIIDMQGGTIETDEDPLITLRYSDNGGASFDGVIIQTMGRTGQYLTSIKFGPPLGSARSRVYEVSWSAPLNTAINRGWSEHDPLPW